MILVRPTVASRALCGLAPLSVSGREQLPCSNSFGSLVCVLSIAGHLVASRSFVRKTLLDSLPLSNPKRSTYLFVTLVIQNSYSITDFPCNELGRARYSATQGALQ